MPSNLVSRSRINEEAIASASLEEDQRRQQHQPSVEYYDDAEYYDEERPVASVELSRESKAARHDGNESSLYEDSYYYDDDDYEELTGAEAPAVPPGESDEEPQEPKVSGGMTRVFFFFLRGERVRQSYLRG